MPRLLPIGGRGPYAVGIATEHIRTPVAAVGDNNAAAPIVDELWPLELMAQVSRFIQDSQALDAHWFVLLPKELLVAVVAHHRNGMTSSPVRIAFVYHAYRAWGNRG